MNTALEPLHEPVAARCGVVRARQIAKPAEIGLSGGFMPFWSNFIVWSATPD